MSDYCKAARPEPPRCIGLQLRPYSLGHHVSLRAYDSVLLNGGFLYSDFILAVFICSQSWQGWQEWKSSWKFPVFLKLWGCFAGRFDLKREGEVFAAYLAEGERSPEVNIPTESRALSGAWESRLKLFLIRELGLTHEQAMDYPLALAWQDYCAAGEEAGKISLISDADRKGLEFVHSDRYRDLAQEAQDAALRELEEMKAKAAQQKEKAN